MPAAKQWERRCSMNPFVFLVGCARSGTTLLQRIVNAHPQIAVMPELDWITNCFHDGETWLGREGRVTREQAAELAAHKRFRQFEVSREELLGLLGSDEPVPYVVFLCGLFALYGKIKGKPLVGSKTPTYVSRILALHAVWPEAKFIHLIRDGRDVCLSVLNWDHAYRTAGRHATWAEDPVSTVALWWERKVRLGRQRGRTLDPDLYYEVRYEHLIARPAEECAKLCAFLGVPYDEAMLRFHESVAPPHQKSHPWSPITSGLRDWQTQMPAADLEGFEAAAGGLLVELGYARAFPSPSPDRQQHAARMRDLFTRDARAQQRVLPQDWLNR